MGAPPSPPPDDLVRIERALGWRPTSSRPATVDRGTGGTAARWVVSKGDRSAFVKIGATALTAEWTRTEYANYRTIHGWFMPELVGFDDDGERPVLALEDLSDAAWPPPWTDERVAAMLDAFGAIAATPPPPLEDRLLDGPQRADWELVANDPRAFLALGLCSQPWLERALPALLDAAESAPLAGDALAHLDVRGDNVCFRDGRAVVIDWNHAQLANPEFDIAIWLPSLHAEGGPAPEAIIPDAPGLAAWLAGYFCAHAGLPPVPDAPHVRPLQRMQARTALPWAARALGLPVP